MATNLQAPVRAVLFDVDGTLYLQRPLRIVMACEMAVASLVGATRQRPTQMQVVLAFRTTREKLRGSNGTGEPLVTRQYSAVSECLGCQPADVQRAVDEWIYRRPLKWLRACRRRGLDQFFNFLAGRGVRCGVFSDYPSRDKLAALRLAGRFDIEVSAVDREVDAFKPDPRGFLAAAGRWGIPSHEILYVGDRLDIDAVGARSAGMQCAVLTRRRSRGDSGFVPVAGFRELQRVLDSVC